MVTTLWRVEDALAGDLKDLSRDLGGWFGLDRADVEDLVQDAAVRVLAKLRVDGDLALRFNDANVRRAYIRNTLKNAARSFLRRAPKKPSKPLAAAEHIADDQEPWQVAAAQELRGLVNRVRDELDEPGKLALNVILGVTKLCEYARAKGISRKTASRHFAKGIRSARCALEHAVQEEWGEEALREFLRKVPETDLTSSNVGRSGRIVNALPARTARFG